MPLLEHFLGVVAEAAGRGQNLAPPPPRAGVEETAAAVVRDLGLQTALPRAQPLGFQLRLPDLVLWIALLAAAVLAAYWLRDVRWRWGRRTAAADEAAAAAAAAGAADHLARARRLAAEGMFAAGMHEILLAAFREVRERAGGAMADSLTGREIVRQAPLAEAARQCLGALVSRVEWTYFGARPASAEDWRACLENFETLRGALAMPGEGR